MYLALPLGKKATEIQENKNIVSETVWNAQMNSKENTSGLKLDPMPNSWNKREDF